MNIEDDVFDDGDDGDEDENEDNFDAAAVDGFGGGGEDDGIFK